MTTNGASEGEEVASPVGEEKVQPLAPLFLLGFALMGVGFYLGLSPSEQRPVEAQMSEEREESGVGELRPLALDRVQLAYRAHGPRVYRMELTQQTEGEFVTAIQVDVEESVEAVEADLLAFERVYREVEVTIRDGASSVGREVVEQVEALLVDSVSRAHHARGGRLIKSDVSGIANPQVRRMMRLVQDAHRWLVVQVREDELNVGDAWEYELPMDLVDEAGGVELRGGARVESRLVRLEERGGARLAVVEQVFSPRVIGDVEGEEDLAFELEGEGRGTVWFDLDRGLVDEAELKLERRLSVEGPGGASEQSSQIELVLRSLARQADE